MQFKVDIGYSEKLEKFLQKYYHYGYELGAGFTDHSNLKKLFSDYEELFDIDIVNPTDIEQKEVSIPEQKRLFLSTITGLISKLRSSDVLDQLNNEIYFTTGPRLKNKSLNNALSDLPNTKNREKRLNAGRICKSVIAGFDHNLIELIDSKNGFATELGYKNYIDEIDNLQNFNTNTLELQCKTFLNDTDYIYRDLTSWHLKKYMNLKIKDATYEDILFLYNSYEFYEYFKSDDPLKKVRYCLSEMGLVLYDNINIDMISRKNKQNSASTYPVRIPDQLFISINKRKNIEDYKSLLSELGKAMFLGSVNSEETFDNKRLIDLMSIETFKDLFKRMAYKQNWIARYLKIPPDKNFIQFLTIKELTEIRDLCCRLILYRYIYQTSNLEEIKKIMTDFYIDNMCLKANTEIILLDTLIKEETPYLSFNSLVIESYLEEFLKDRYDEQWWRDTNAGNMIKNLWKLGACLTHGRICDLLKIDEIASTLLIRNFEEII